MAITEGDLNCYFARWFDLPPDQEWPRHLPFVRDRWVITFALCGEALATEFLRDAFVRESRRLMR